MICFDVVSDVSWYLTEVWRIVQPTGLVRLCPSKKQLLKQLRPELDFMWFIHVYTGTWPQILVNPPALHRWIGAPTPFATLCALKSLKYDNAWQCLLQESQDAFGSPVSTFWNNYVIVESAFCKDAKIRLSSEMWSILQPRHHGSSIWCRSGVMHGRTRLGPTNFRCLG